MKQLDKLRYFFEKYGFRVCSRLADFLGIRSKHVRLFFIYSSFFSLGFGFRYTNQYNHVKKYYKNTRWEEENFQERNFKEKGRNTYFDMNTGVSQTTKD